MSNQSQREREYRDSRRRIAFSFAIILGLIIGFFMKRVTIGILIGLAIGLMASTMTRKD